MGATVHNDSESLTTVAKYEIAEYVVNKIEYSGCE